MSFKVAFIGAGSVGFTRTLFTDLMSVPEFRDMEVAFTDINQHNLDMVTELCQRDLKENGIATKIHWIEEKRFRVQGILLIVCASVCWRALKLMWRFR